MITQEQLDDAILTVTGMPDWELVIKFLVHEALITRDSCADAQSWEEVCSRRGFAEGLAYVANLRETTKRAQEERNADVQL